MNRTVPHRAVPNRAVPYRTGRVGVIGAGQLARMLQAAAIGLGIELVVLGQADDDPAAAVAVSHRRGSMPPTATDLAALAADVDVITVEHEILDLEALADLERTGVVCRPSVATLAMVIDKAAMRATLAEAGLPAPAWAVATDAAGLDTVLDDMVATSPTPSAGVVVKATRGGYDGRGVVIAESVDVARAAGREMLRSGWPVLIEERLALTAEIAVIVARASDGATVTYPAVRTIQADGQCRQVDFPAGLGPEIDAEARRLAERAAAAVGVVGVLAVEMFVVGDRVVINELAARPHNSGHLTIEASTTSQFENHLRAITGLPLGPTDAVVGSATMVNLIGSGEEPSPEPAEALAVALAIEPAAHVHLYGKAWRPERKVGHVTLCSADRVDPAAVWRVVEALGGARPAAVGDDGPVRR